MKDSVIRNIAVLLVLVISGGHSAFVESEDPDPTNTTNRSHSFVRLLESLYAKSVAAARGGDVENYKRTRTHETNRITEDNLKKMGKLDKYAEMIQSMANSRPNLKEREFLRCDTTKEVARLAYSKKPSEDSVEYHIIMFDYEESEWKIRYEGNVFASKRSEQISVLDEYLSHEKFRLQ